MTWASRRRFWYIAGVACVVVLLGAGVGYLIVHDAPTCSDGEQNGDETGIDCGGLCQRVCSFEAADPSVLWTRFFEVTQGVFSVVGLIENPNVGLEARDVPYRFEIRDATGALITARAGLVYFPPDTRRVPVFEANIQTGGVVPRTVFLSLPESIEWVRATGERPKLVVDDEKLEKPDVSPKLTATLRNDSLVVAEDVYVTALLTDIHKNAVAVSRTVVPYLSRGAVEPLVFTWPSELASVLVACPVPVSVGLLFDVSGSMNDSSAEPPQPLTDAKNAAVTFVETLQDGDQVGLVTFATTATIQSPRTTLHAPVTESIRSIAIEPAEETGGTNIGDALRVGQELLGGASSGVRQALVLLTDGMANLPGETPVEYAKEQADIVKRAGVEVYVIGLGDTIDETFLKALVSNESQYYHASSSDELANIYQDVSEDMCERSAVVQVELFPIAGPVRE